MTKNGNRIHDGANNLTLFYNHLNLIEKAEQNSTVLAKYSYLSDGTKLSATDGVGNGLYYVGSLVYHKQNGVLSLESAGFDGGRFVATAHGIAPLYFLTDHLGSMRAIINGDGGVIERNDYYPFGLRWNANELSDNRYRYNGKEKQAFVNVPYTDYGARMYDPRYRLSWNGIDQLTEIHASISPYTFCNNNPIRFEDKDGRDWRDKAAGVVIGILTNIIPSSSLRESYNPNDENDYITTLAVTDATTFLAGNAMSEGGEYAAIAGTGIATAAATATLATAGAAGEATVPAVVVGRGITLAGIAAKIGGEILMLNATQNAQNGYEYGQNQNNVSSGNKNSPHKNQKAKGSAQAKYEGAKMKYDELKKKPNKTKEDNELLNRYNREVEHYKRKMDETGETHSRNAKGNR